jgi:hypothetical protein
VSADRRLTAAREYFAEVKDEPIRYTAFADLQSMATKLRRHLGAVLDYIGEGETGSVAATLAAVREVLDGFDWEYHDRQLALEAIQRIVDGDDR